MLEWYINEIRKDIDDLEKVLRYALLSEEEKKDLIESLAQVDGYLVGIIMRLEDR